MAYLRICVNRVSFVDLDDVEWAIERAKWVANAREGRERNGEYS